MQEDDYKKNLSENGSESTHATNNATCSIFYFCPTKRIWRQQQQPKQNCTYNHTNFTLANWISNSISERNLK